MTLRRLPAAVLFVIAVIVALVCLVGALLATVAPTSRTTEATVAASSTPVPPTAAPTTSPPPAQPEAAGARRITGTIGITNRFALSDNAEPFVMLEDKSGFVTRDLKHVFPVESQVSGPVTIPDNGLWTYELALPIEPRAPLVDVDNNGQDDQGVQVFVVAYWTNTWGDPFLEPRDGHGWSTAYSSAELDSGQDNEIIGGKMVVWAPDDAQGFPTGFGDDGKLFTDDDPAAPIPAGYPSLTSTLRRSRLGANPSRKSNSSKARLPCTTSQPCLTARRSSRCGRPSR